MSPWQFKNLNTTDNDWVEYSDTLWHYRWLQAIQDVQPDIVEIVTWVILILLSLKEIMITTGSWNDYAESHYIGDINSKVNLGTYAPNYVSKLLGCYNRC